MEDVGEEFVAEVEEGGGAADGKDALREELEGF